MRKSYRNSCFSEIYNVHIQVFYSIAFQDLIARVNISEGGLTLSKLYSGDHYDLLLLKFEGDKEPNIYHKKDFNNKITVDLKQLTRDNKSLNDDPIKYTVKTLTCILKYI